MTTFRKIPTPVAPATVGVAALVPAHNEERVISETLQALLRVLPKEDIYVVDDGSTDRTVMVAQQLVPHVLSLDTQHGKAGAMNVCIAHFQLPQRYTYLLPMDADTKISRSFLSQTVAVMEQDTHQQIACVVGKVTGKSQSWVTTFRLWEYEVAQTIHKAAQSREKAIIVCPGCATLYRSLLFTAVSIPSGTLTEDMDFTFLLHRRRLGDIVYLAEAVVATQDPLTLRDFIRQIDRWYTGFWQCIVKHNIPWGGQTLDLEVAMLATEGLFNGLLVVTMMFLIPFSLLHHPRLLLIPFLFDLCFFLLPTMLLTAIRHRSWRIFFYLPQFYLARFISCLVFLFCFLKVTLGKDVGMVWNKAARYQVVS